MIPKVMGDNVYSQKPRPPDLGFENLGFWDLDQKSGESTKSDMEKRVGGPDSRTRTPALGISLYPVVRSIFFP